MRRIKVWCATGALLMASACGDGLIAGGFDRFDQGIDLLFDRGHVTVDMSYGVAVPNRKYDTVNGLPEQVRLGPASATRPSFNLKFTPFKDAACLAAYREPFGSETDYGMNWSQARFVVARRLKIEEIGLTCSYGMPVANGYVRVIGGVTKNFGFFHEETLRVLPNGTGIRPTIEVDDMTYGWRAGVAYEVPGQFIRATLMYYSPLDFHVKGVITQLPLGGNAFLPIVPVHSDATIPQTVEFTLQFPIAPNLLNTFSVKWADWSVWTRVPVILSVTSGPVPAGRELSVYNAFFVDGWTVSNTISRRLNDVLSLALRLSWDRGVGTGWTEHTDSWSANLAAIYKVTESTEFIGAVGLSILTAGAIDKLAQGGTYNATFGTGTYFTARGGFRYRFAAPKT